MAALFLSFFPSSDSITSPTAHLGFNLLTLHQSVISPTMFSLCSTHGDFNLNFYALVFFKRSTAGIEHL
jgi:hypothetical protein